MAQLTLYIDEKVIEEIKEKSNAINNDKYQK